MSLESNDQSIAQVEKAIIHGRTIIEKHREDGRLHETATRYTIVDPIL